ncbi:MAG: cytidine deaminase [Rhodothermaceae bacterium]|nr:cytidine deaminase [Rhodothermaceae bacterium]
MPDTPIDALRALAHSIEDRAYVPYSGRKESVAALLSDGTWVPGVRVENASFPLLIPALLSATCTMRCAGRADLVAVVQSQPFDAAAPAFLTGALDTDWTLAAPDLLVAGSAEALPAPAQMLTPAARLAITEPEGLARAADAATRAHIPESNFPVGCVVETSDGDLVPGCNVEHPDWTRGLCAERVALATARSYGLAPPRRLFLTCPKDPGATPCGACRQVLVELAAGVPLVIDRGDGPPETTTPEALLPGAFIGDGLRA